MKSNLLFVPRHETSWSKMKTIIDVLQDNFNCEVLIFSEKLDRLITNNYNKLKIKKFQKDNFFQSTLNKFDGFLNKNEKLSNNFFLSFFRIFVTAFIYKSEISYFKKFLKKFSTDLILIPGDRELSPVLPIIKAAKILKVKSLICVTSIPDPHCLHYQRAKSNFFFTDFKYGGNLINKISSILLPKQTFTLNKKKILFSPGWRTLGLHLAGCISKNPWVQGGGNSDYILEFDKEFKKKSEILGREKNKTFVLPDPGLKKIKKISSKQKKNILFCIPQDAEHNLISWQKHFERIRTIAKAIRNLKIKESVIFNLHPKSMKSNYMFLKDEFDFIFGKKNFYDYLPKTKLVICSASSIIPVTIASETPVLNIDDLKYWNEKVVNIKFGVKTIKSLENLDSIIEAYYKIITKRDFKKKLGKSAILMSDRLLEKENFNYKINETLNKILK